MHRYSGSASGRYHSGSAVVISGTKEVTLTAASASSPRSSTSVPASSAAFLGCFGKVSFATRKHSGSASYPTSTRCRGTVKQVTAVENVPTNSARTRFLGWLIQNTGSRSTEFDFCSDRNHLGAPASPPSVATTITHLPRSGPLTSLLKLL